jgi:hypothetical protein
MQWSRYVKPGAQTIDILIKGKNTFAELRLADNTCKLALNVIFSFIFCIFCGWGGGGGREIKLWPSVSTDVTRPSFTPQIPGVGASPSRNPPTRPSGNPPTPKQSNPYHLTLGIL